MDEHDDVGCVTSGAESSAVTVTKPSSDETLMENMACEGQIEESYNGGDGEEIMIEVVGSDVLVDGMGGHGDGLGKEGLGGDMESFRNESVVGGDIGSREVGDLGGQLWQGRTETGAEGVQDFHGVLDQRSGEVVVNEGVVVPGSSMEETNVVVSQGLEVSVREEGEGKVVGAGELTGGGDEPPGNQSQGIGVLDDGAWNPGIDALVVSSLPMVESESEKGEIVGEEGPKMVEEEDLSRKDDILGGDVVRDGLQSSGKDESSVVETISEASNKDTVRHASPESQTINEASNKDSVASSVHLADCLDTVGEHALTGNNVSARSVSDVLGTEPELSIAKNEILEQGEIPATTAEDSSVEAEAPFSDEKGQNVTHSKDFQSAKEEKIFGSHGDDIHAAPESSLEQSSVVDRGEWIAMNIDEVLDFKDEAIVVDAADTSVRAAGNTEENFGKQIITPDLGDVAANATSAEDGTCMKEATVDFRGDEGLEQSDLGISNENKLSTGYAEAMEENKRAGFRGEVSDGNEPIQKNEQFNTLVVTEGAEKKVIVEAESVLSHEQNGKVVPMEISADSHLVVGVPCCDARSSLGDRNENVEKEGLSKGEDSMLSSDPNKGAAVEVHNTAFQGTDSNAEVNTSIQDHKPEVVDTLMHEVHVDQTTGAFVVDEIPNEGAYAVSISKGQVSAGSEASQPNGDQTSKTSGSEVIDKLTDSKSNLCCDNDNDMMQVDVPEIKSTEDLTDIGVGQQYTEDGLLDNKEQDISSGQSATEMDQSKKTEEKTTNVPSIINLHQDGYFLAPGNEVEFSITDLVWGKVRSHPWWPGQIFDPADASEKAAKYHKKDCFLVAYFGDRTFAWNDASLLKPFRPHFSQIEKQSNSEAFQNAISCALDEVSRRVQLGLSCSCIPGDAYGKVECQIVENTGIREESSRRHGVDKSSGASSFEPDKLLQYMRSLAESPFCLVDRLELVLAHAQLSAFCHFKGYREPPVFEARDAMFENDAWASTLSDAVDQSVPVSNVDEQLSSSQKHKQNVKDNLHARKERSLSELMGDMEYSTEGEENLDDKALTKSVPMTSGKKRKAADSLTDGSERRTTFYAAKVSTTSSSPRPSFRVGDCIRRVASQLTGSVPVLKGHNEQAGADTSPPMNEDPQEITVVPTEISSLEDMLSQLQLAARDPKKGYSFLSNIIIFFSGFRNSVVRKHTSVGRSSGGRKRKANHTTGGFTEEFEFDDVNDTYWKDRIVQNYSEEQLLQDNEIDDRYYQIVASDPHRIHKSGRGSHSRKRYSNGNFEMSAYEQAEDVDRKKLELSPAELVLSFTQGDRLPSEVKLNKMFRRFGPLKEAETEVDQDSYRARVIFKRGADAEVACSSAGRINIFGSMLVGYQLSYSPSTTFSLLPLMLQGSEDAI